MAFEDRVGVGDERRPPHPRGLRGERGREREQVVDEDVRRAPSAHSSTTMRAASARVGPPSSATPGKRIRSIAG